MRKFILKKIESIANWIYFLCFPSFGLMLSDISDLKIYKVLNLIGILWSLAGFITASFLLNRNESVQLSALRVSGYIMSILVVQLPLGIMLGSVFALIYDYPSAHIANKLGMLLIVPGIISFFIFDGIAIPKPHVDEPIKQQTLFMGGYFLFFGLVAQLFGAFFDLIGFNG